MNIHRPPRGALAAFGAVCCLLASASALAAAPEAARPNHARFGAAWYLSPWDGIALDGFQIGGSYHYKVADQALIGGSLSYVGLKADRALEDLPFFSETSTLTPLRIHQVRLGAKALFGPRMTPPAPKGRNKKPAKSLPLWPYGGAETGLAIHVVTDRSPATRQVSAGSGDWYIKPAGGVLFAPGSPFTGYLEAGYVLVPTYKFMDKSFSFYGAPTAKQIPLNTDGFTLEAGLAYQF